MWFIIGLLPGTIRHEQVNLNWLSGLAADLLCSVLNTNQALALIQIEARTSYSF